MCRPSPLNLESYGIASFSFMTDKEYVLDKGLDLNGCKITVDREYKTNTENDSYHMVELKIFVRPKKRGTFPYKIKLELGGFFITNKSDQYTEDTLRAIVYINGASMLYGVAREYIFMATCHNMCGPFMLPSVSFRPDSDKGEKAVSGK